MEQDKVIPLKVKIVGLKIAVPDDFKILKAVYLKNYEGLEKYCLECNLHEGNIYLETKWSKLEYCYIDYIPFDTDRIKRAINFVCIRHMGHTIERYYEVVLYANEDFFENNDLHESPYSVKKTKHQVFIERVDRFFKSKHIHA